MNDFRTINDLLEIGIRVERCLLDYYRRMRDHIEHSYGKDQFDSLAAAEQAHIVMLRRFLDSCGDDEEEYNLNKEQNKSQNSLVSHAMRVFNRAEEVTTIEDGLEALGIGTELEIESISFFTELQALFLGEQQDLITLILDDEKSHLLKLIAITKKATF
ncbi:MAG: ferritin family protein [bacterium]